MNENNCPFCDDAQRYRYIVEGKTVRMIYPKSPTCTYHLLIVPHRHVAQFDELSSEELLEAHTLIKGLVKRAKATISDFTGYNLMSNNGGPAVRQHVMHCHVHIFLRAESEKVDPFQPVHSRTVPEFTERQRADLQRIQTMFGQPYDT